MPLIAIGREMGAFGAEIAAKVANALTRETPKESDDWRAFETVGRLLERHRWEYARTEADSHQFTFRKKWVAQEPACGDADFAHVVRHLRAFGYPMRHRRNRHVGLDVNGRCYWSAGAQNGANLRISRMLSERAVEYDAIAPVYDSLFDDSESRSENAALMDLLGDVSKRSVLDIGAGTGLLLDYQAIDRYVGIDPSGAMIERLNGKHPGANVIKTPLRSFVGGTYDLVVALFGTASYLSELEIARIPTLLHGNGRYFLMFYAPDYFPEVYRRSRHYPASGVSWSVPCGPYRDWHSYRILEGGPDDKPCIERGARVFRE